MNTAIKITILVTNAVLALALVFLVFKGRIQWDQFLVGLGLLVAPSAGGLVMGAKSNGNSTPPKDGVALIACALASALAVGGVTSGCSVFTPKNVKTVLNDAQVACVILNATLDDATVAKTCQIADDVIPDIRPLLEQARARIAKDGITISRKVQ